MIDRFVEMIEHGGKIQRGQYRRCEDEKDGNCTKIVRQANKHKIARRSEKMFAHDSDSTSSARVAVPSLPKLVRRMTLYSVVTLKPRLF